MTILLYDLAGADPAVRFSPNCWRVRMALLHKALDFETVPWRFTDKEAIAFSGQGAVPVIQDGAKVVHDSLAIAQHLEQAYGDEPTLFGGPAGEALTTFVRHWTLSILHPGVSKLILLDLFDALDERDKPYFRETREARFGAPLEQVADPSASSLEAFRGSLQPLRNTLREQPFLGGQSPLFPDYIVFGAFQWARAVSPLELLDADDPVYAWRERLLDSHDGAARQAPVHRPQRMTS